MLLIALVVSKHINTVEIRLVNSMRLIRTALLEYQPASRFRVTPDIFITRCPLFVLAIQTLPRHKLPPSAIKNDVAGNRELHLLAVDPTGRRGRRRRWQSHLVPELIRLLWFLIVVLLS